MTRIPFRALLLRIAAGTGIGLLFVAQNASVRVIENLPLNLDRLLRSQLVTWIAWALLYSLIVRYAARHPFDRQRLWRILPGWLLFGSVICLLHTAGTFTLGHYLHWIQPPPPPAVPRLWFGIVVSFMQSLVANLLIVTLIAAASYARTYAREARERALRASQLEARLATAELDNLRMQLQPHFLFNALNTVSSLMDRDVAAARGVLTSLGDMLRDSLEGMSAQEVTLADELAFLQRYLDIQQLRYQDRLTVTVDVAPDVAGALVPSLLLQPLVENAIRHGIEPLRAPGHITVVARRTGERLRIEVVDDGPGAPNAPAAGARTGVGLRNTRARLAQLYEGDHHFEAGNRAEGGFRVVVEVPWQAS